MSSTLSPFIVRKLAGLGSDPRQADLDALHKLLDTVPPERVVSDEEVQELENLEKKTLGNQKEYKKETENMNKRTKFTILFCMLFPLLFILSIIMAENLPEYGFFGKCIILMTFWPTKLIAVVILFHFCGFDLQPEVSENEDDDDDDDWQYLMTSTELQSRHKALVNRWEQLKTEREGDLVSVILFDIAFFINLLYYFIRVAVLHVFIVEESNYFSSLSFLTKPRSIFFFVEYIFSMIMALLFYVPFWANVIQIITFKKNLVSKLQDRVATMSKKEPPILAALHKPDPEEAKLKAIRNLLKGVQEEGVVSDEEIRKLKKLENELLKRQKMYKKLLGNWNQKWKFTTRFYMLFPIPLLLCFLFLGKSLAAYGKFILLMSSWPVKSVAILILFYFYRFDLNFPTWPEAPENEDDDWQDSMTSTEFQSRGKALLNSWEQLKTERNEHNASENLALFLILIICCYSFLRVSCIDWLVREESIYFSSFTFSSVFFFVEYIFSVSLALLFFIQILAEYRDEETWEKKKGLMGNPFYKPTSLY